MTGQGSWNESTSSKSSEKSQFRPNDFMYIPNWQLKEFLGKFAWRLKPLFRIIMAYWPFDIYNSRYIFCKPFYNIARKFVFSNSIARAYFISLLCTLMTSTNKSLEEKNFPSGWKCYKTIGSYVTCAFIKIWSTWEVWRALKKLELLSATPRATLTHLSCSPNFPRASYLDERTLTYEPIVNFCWVLSLKFSQEEKGSDRNKIELITRSF